MLTGKRFRLARPTLALDVIDGDRRAVTIPAQAIVEVVAGPSGQDRMLDVRWEGRTVTMFAIDLKVRGTEITDRTATA